MATIAIQRSAATVLSPLIDDSSKRYKTLNGADYIVLSFKHDSWVEFFPGDYITWDGETYTIQQTPKFDKKSARHYDYEIRFEGPYYALDNAMFLLDDVEGEFFLTGTAEDFVDLIVSNLNRVHGAGSYFTGTVPSTDFKNLGFNNETCLNVLQRICEEFELEYYFSTGININLATSIGNSTGLSYQYAAGLRNITRSKFNEKDLITRLFAYGSEKNIDYNYPTKRLHLPVATYPNRYMQQNQGTYGIREAVKHWDDIYPHFEGTVDSSSADNVIIDAAIDFNLNDYLIEGVSAKIVFKTGDLAGMEFEISAFDNATKQVTFMVYTDEFGEEFPSASFNPSVGDEFTFVDITMPTAYITAAESELATAALAYLGDMSSPNVTYEVEVDWHHLQASSTSLDVGDLVEIVDTQLAPGGINYRILQLEQSIANEYKYTIKTGEFVLVTYISRVNTARQNITRELRAFKKEVTLDTRRGYLATDELRGSIFDNDGYFDTTNIRPLSIETSMLSVGNKSTQLTLTGVLAQPNHQGNNAYLDISAGDLIHFTIDASVRTWNITPYSTTSLSSGSAYYMYVQCPKVGSTATWIISTTQYQVDPDDGYYYFLVGFLSSVISDERIISWLYGQTTINGGFIRTGRISSISGATYFDLESATIVGAITFESGSSGYANISDIPTSLADINSSEATDLANALSTANSAQTDATQALSDAAAAQSTADGKIVSYWQDSEPTGASEGDIWFDTNDGNKIYVYDTGTWVESQDDDIALAIANAQTAQTTADGKALVFFQTSQPGSGMSEGDIWIDTDDDYKQYVYSGSAWVETTSADALQALSDAAAAQSTADGKIVAYYQDSEPSGGSEGDIWFDTNDGNKIYVYDSGNWVESQDNDIALAINNAQTAQSTADGKALVFFQDAAPGSGMSAHDLWVDTNDGNKTYIYSGAAWVATSTVDAINALANAATAQSTADGKIQSFYQTEEPTSGMSHGDLWFDIDDGNKVYVYTEGYWPSFTGTTFWQDTEPTSGMVDGDMWIDTDDSNTAYEYDATIHDWILFTGTVYIQTTEPTTGMSAGDMWYDSDDSNKAYIYVENVWVESQDSDIAVAISDAADAQSTADGKITTFFAASSAPPTAEGVGDLWFQTDTGKLIRWNGSSWGQDVADITQTIIDGGLITTGRIEVKNSTTTQGGITGTTAAGSTAIGLWLGSTYANRATAPFRVTHGGAVTMTSATVQSGASGERIMIDSSDHSLKWYNSGGTLRMEISGDSVGSGPGFWCYDSSILVQESDGTSTIHGGSITISTSDTSKNQLLYLTNSQAATVWSYALDVRNTSTSASATGVFHAIHGESHVDYASINIGVYGRAATGTTNWAGYFEDGNVRIENNLFVGDRSTAYSTALEKVLVIAATGSGSQAGLELVGNQTSNLGLCYLNFHNYSATTQSNRQIAQISVERYNDNDAGRILFYVWDSTGTARVCNSITTSSQVWYVAGTAELYLNATALRPYTSAGLNLGNSTYRWGDIHGEYLFLRNQTPTAKSYKLVTNNGDGEQISFETDASDKRLKKNIKPIKGALDKVLAMNGYTFNFNKKGQQITGQDPTILRSGLIAQEVQAVFPAPVHKIGDTDYLNIRYDDLTGLLVEAIKELNIKLDQL